MPTLADLARAGTLNVASAPLPMPNAGPAVTLAMLARAGLLGGDQAAPPSPETPDPSALAEFLRTQGIQSGPQAGVGDLGNAPPPSPPPTLPAPYSPSVPPPTNALMPQTQEEQASQDQSNRVANAAFEMSGISGLRRGGQAIIEGDIPRGIGNIGAALIPYSPLRGLATLGAGYGGAAVSDLADFLRTPRANAQGPAAPESDLSPADEARRAELRKRLQGRLRDEVRESLAEELARIDARADASRTRRENARIEAEGGERRANRAEYDATVERANRALAEARTQRVRPFRETGIGRLYEDTAGWTPGLVGFGTSALARFMRRPRTESLIEGTAAGAVTPNAPLVYDLYNQPSYNPERRMYQEYARDLPPGHPRREEWRQYAERQPEENPARRLAAQEFYDPLKMAERLGTGALEGIVGGFAGGHVGHGARTLAGNIGSGLGRMFGRRESTPPPGPSGPTGPNAGPANPPPPAPNAVAPPAPPNYDALRQSARTDRNLRIAPDAPPSQVTLPNGTTATELWVSDRGRDAIALGPDGVYRFVGGVHGGRGGQNAGNPRGRPGWRRISSIEADQNANIG